jgi:sugar phosphate permease
MMERKPIFHWAWITLAIGVANFFTIFSVRLGYGILLPQMSNSLSLTKAQGGLIYSFFFFAYLFFSPIFGNLNDRIGSRKVIGFFSIFTALGTALMGIMSSFWSGVLFFTIAGFGTAALYSPIVSLIQRWFGERRRGLALGILQMGSALGIASMGILLPIFVSRFDWRFCWFLLGGLMFILFFVNACYLRDDPKELEVLPWGSASGSASQRKEERKASYHKIFRLRLFWMIGISYLFISASFYAIFTFIVMYGVMEIGVSHAAASGWMTQMSLSGLLGAPIMLFLSDSIGRKKTILLCQLFIFLSAYGLVLSKGSTVGLMACVSALGFFFHPVWPLYGACARDYFEDHLTGTIIGLWTLFYGVGGVIAPALAGYLADRTETFVYSFIFAIVLVSISSLFMLWVKGINKISPAETSC